MEWCRTRLVITLNFVVFKIANTCNYLKHCSFIFRKNSFSWYVPNVYGHLLIPDWFTEIFATDIFFKLIIATDEILTIPHKIFFYLNVSSNNSSYFRSTEIVLKAKSICWTDQNSLFNMFSFSSTKVIN